ncbi:MAG: FAD-dependent oxidoreductase [Cellvibrionaceae bacterium]
MQQSYSSTNQTKAQANSLSIAIAGAGLLGRLLAWRLSQLGYHVEIFEAGSFSKPASAAHTAAAMISPLSEVVISDRSIYDLGLQSLEIWPQYVDDLNNSLQNQPTKKAIQYSSNGSIIVAHPQDHSELRQFKNDLQIKLGNEDNSVWLDNIALTKKEPNLDHFQEGLFLPNEAYLDNRQLLKNLHQVILNSGVVCHEHSPIGLEKKNLSFSTMQTLNKFDWVFDCRGLGRKECEPNLRGVRGEIMWVETKEVQFSHPIRLCHPRYKLYVVPKPNHQFIIGATEIESEDTSPISIQSTLELSSALYTINPAFAEARVIETDVNLRPAYLDNLPKIIYTSNEQCENIISINGLYRHGYLLAPALIEQSLQLFQQTTNNKQQTTNNKQQTIET